MPGLRGYARAEAELQWARTAIKGQSKESAPRLQWQAALYTPLPIELQITPDTKRGERLDGKS